MPEVIANSLQRKDFLDEYLGFLCTQPAAITSDVNNRFYSRPELVPDEKGRTLPVHTDKYISSVFFDVVHSAVKGATIWNCAYCLLQLVAEFTEKAHKVVLLQELSNICHIEYTRTQDTLRRYLATGTGSKWLRRVSNSKETRLVTKSDPELLKQENPQLHYLLHLCQPKTSVSSPVNWITKLDQLHKLHPQERADLSEQEADALCDLAIIVGFTQSLSAAFPMPSFNRNKGKAFVSAMTELEANLTQVKAQIDLTDFVAPIDNLLEPGAAEHALKALDQSIVEQMGTGLGSLYQDLMSDCAKRLHKQMTEDKVGQVSRIVQKTESEFIDLPSDDTVKPQEGKPQERKQKEKTRPAHSSIYEIVLSARGVDNGVGERVSTAARVAVRSASAETFGTLFSKSEARGSITWKAFETAMSEVGFSIIPEYGSVYTFSPSDGLALGRSIKIHRPHQSRIEGHKLLFIARYLSRTYGWTKDTFQVA